MKKLIYFVLIILLSFSISCDDGFLDTTPYNGLANTQIFTSNANATLAVRGVYSSLAKQAINGRYFNMILTVLGPEGYGHSRSTDGMSYSMGLGTIDDANVRTLYSNLYRPIIYANDVIAGLTDNTQVTEALRDQFIGEAKFIRGVCYFYLMELFGGVVILDKPTAVTELFPRNTKEQVREFIIKDFTDAVAALPLTNSGRATKGAAIAMLGKTYLYNKQWSLALAEFEKLMTTPYTYNLVADYQNNFRWQTKNGVESVFEIQYANIAGAGSEFDSWFGNRTTSINQGGDYAELSVRAFQAFTYANGTPISFATIPLRTAFPTGTAGTTAYGVALTAWYETTMVGVDKRLHQSAILPGSFYQGYTLQNFKLQYPVSVFKTSNPPALWHTYGDDALIPIRKFITVGQENMVSNVSGPANFPMIRYADILLMYAEAKNEISGAVPEVYTAVDRIRTRAGINTLASLKPGLSKENMRREIWLERFREFMFESILYFDVRRWEVAHTADPIFGLNNEEWDYRLMTKWYTKKFNDTRDYLWPIPKQEIDRNPLMEQNPNWN